MLCQIRVRINKQGNCDFTADDIKIRVASQQELNQAIEEMPDQLSQKSVDSALARGEICAAVFSDSRIIAFQCASFAASRDNDYLWVKFDAPYRYGHNGYTRPEYRGCRIAQHASLAQACAGGHW